MADQRFVPTPRYRGGSDYLGGGGYPGGGAGARSRPARSRPGSPPGRRSARSSAQPLADLLDRLVDTGAVVSGDVVVALAGVDLLRVDLRLLLVGVQTAIEGSSEGSGEVRP
ncbi:gas vesicle protein [Parafrankia elaeagni]|uniref:gas vesicle protein n=1 Tax=Parafrankia elaeagni TaxID=222534 RepID=UPI00037723A5|nr:gas vesicle protein [Parafrankia elaeagni]